tara:strand:+ start:43003 stop:44409 length:1407 start_codon:yes stop_codon:yes gene_type:complete
MLLGFFERLREYGVPVSTREILDCLNLFEHRILQFAIDDFYYLSRTSLVKDEKYYDRFDRAFDAFFSGLDSLPSLFAEEEIETQLQQLLQSGLTDIRPQDIDQAISEYHEQTTLAQLSRATLPGDGSDSVEDDDQQLDLSREAKESGNACEGDVKDPSEENGESGESREEGEKGKAGEDGETGEEGESGEEGEKGEEGERGDEGEKGEGDGGIEGEGKSDQGEIGTKSEFAGEASQRAQKLWQLRRFEDFDADVELGTRNLKMALRRIRKFARTGAELELDLPNTIRGTARNGGLLDIVEVPEKHNSIKVLLFLDVGGTMDDHIELCAQLFSAARYEFKFLESYYFHNFIYESIWLDNNRRTEAKTNTWDVIRKFGSDYKIIFVGDANMARHEIAERGGSVEHFNGEAGQVWMQRIQDQFRKIVWLNPVPESRWQDSYTAVMIKRMLEDQMYPLSVEGIERAARYLVR